jgi:hypothetical protein
MNLLGIFALLSSHLIPIMLAVLMVSLIMRYIAYKSGRTSQAYFNQFSRTVQKIFEEKHRSTEEVEDVDRWITMTLERVTAHLPDRNLRFSAASKKKRNSGESLESYTSGKRSIILSVRGQIEVFRSIHPPNYSELTRRILDQDKEWRTLLGFFPIDVFSRLFNVMPGLFVIGGIFGTFLGITSALPKIQGIDLSNLTEAAPLLNSFVADIGFSMRTSITGIFCSVVMSLVIAAFPLESVRRDVMRNMEHAFEQMWLHLHGGNITPGEKLIIQELRNIVSELSSSASSHNKAS